MRIARRLLTTKIAAKPAALASTNIESIVSAIENLTLLETSVLVTRLKTRLNISDIAPQAISTTKIVENASEKEKVKEKTEFKVILKSFDAKSKAKVIKEVKAVVENLTLVQAKKFVESLPSTIRESEPKKASDELIARFKGIGAVVVAE